MWKDMNFASCNNQKYLGTGGAQLGQWLWDGEGVEPH